MSSIGSHKELKVTNINEPTELGPNDVLIKHTAIGINFDDIMYRRGAFPLDGKITQDKYKILGFEGVGTVQKKGSAVRGFEVGQQVGYGFAPFGAYAQYRVIDYRFLITIPNDIAPDMAAAVLRKGMTAEYLLFKTFRPQKNDWILIHSIAGGVGHLLAKWAKFAGLNVIGTVGHESKVSVALATGCNFVINRAKDDMFKKVAEYTNNAGVKAVFDGIGKPVFDASLACLKPFGIYVSYGYAGGMLDPIDIMKLRIRSAFFTAPMLEIYKNNRLELILSCSEMLSVVKRGVLMPNITRYGFDGIPQAHADLESGKTTGCIVINPY